MVANDQQATVTHINCSPRRGFVRDTVAWIPWNGSLDLDVGGPLPDARGAKSS